MKDILLTPDGDINIQPTGDIGITDSVRQAVRIRLLWFFSEWRFAPSYGVPYYEEILIKNPDKERIKRIIREEAMSVKEVQDVKNIMLDINTSTRHARAAFDIVIECETFREEVLIPWP
jgi:hypothetical protein